MSKVNWSNAPEDAQFYSNEAFRRHEDGIEYLFQGGQWEKTTLNTLLIHKIRYSCFEVRPQPSGIDAAFDNVPGGFEFDTQVVSDTSKRRPHYDLIIAWANGAEIEVLDNGRYVTALRPLFRSDGEYRIKPDNTAAIKQIEKQIAKLQEELQKLK